MELRQLRYFVRIVELGSMSRAAADLDMVQSALSQQITRLEGELCTRLLHRTPRGVAPTEAGVAFFREAQLTLRHAEQAMRAAQQARLSGSVSVGLAPTTSAVLGLPLMQAMRERYPDVRLHMVESMSGHLTAMLNARQLDLAVLFDTRLHQAQQATATPGTVPAAAATTTQAATATFPIATQAAAPSASRKGNSAFNPAIGMILTGTYANLSKDPENWELSGFNLGGDGHGVGPGKRGFSLGESEITFSANVDNLAYGALTLGLDGDNEVEVEVEELTIPENLGEEPQIDEPVVEEPEAPAPVEAKKTRPPMPSWDQIVRGTQSEDGEAF